jgi:hypothetical protein
MCSKDRPLGCQHSCPLACHPNRCPPCKQRLRMRCHCNTQVIYSDCQTFTNASDEQKEKIKSCRKACSKKVNSQKNDFHIESTNICSSLLVTIYVPIHVILVHVHWLVIVHN